MLMKTNLNIKKKLKCVMNVASQNKTDSLELEVLFT